jgi:hypothetical protein
VRQLTPRLLGQTLVKGRELAKDGRLASPPQGRDPSQYWQRLEAGQSVALACPLLTRHARDCAFFFDVSVSAAQNEVRGYTENRQREQTYRHSPSVH